MKNTEPQYPNQISSLPVTPYLDKICQGLKASPSHFLVLTAETAAGKSTAVPLALLNHFAKKILMLEPRRLAVLAIADRVSELLQQQPGETVGYRIQLESRVSPATRLEIITEAILTRRLQEDPSLTDVGVVVIDEFHERSINADLALAFLKESLQLRDNLFVVVMSATIDVVPLCSYLGTDKSPAPLFSVPGRRFPVAIFYDGKTTPAQAVLKELQNGYRTKEVQETGGSILVFLPGIAEIRRCRDQLKEAGASADLFVLHSSLTTAEQRAVLEAPDPNRRRVILSSSIAETSLTVPGVTTVIDCGLARFTRMNTVAGMEQLVTESESVFSAEQRAGRAGRICPGKCIRLWDEHDVRISRTIPEILRTDLTSLVLECAAWGVTTAEQLLWLDAPPAAAWNAAVALLMDMHCLAPSTGSKPVKNKFSGITPLGKAVLTLGVHPRLACTALSALTAKPTDETVLDQTIACALRYSSYKNSSPFLQKKFCRNLKKRILRCRQENSNPFRQISELPVETTALLAGFPDRLARLADDTGTYKFPSGRTALLPRNERESTATFPEWIIAPEADAGERSGKIYSYEILADVDVQQWLTERTTAVIDREFKMIQGKRKLKKTEYRCYGRIVIAQRSLPPNPDDTAEAIYTTVQKNGIEWLPLSEKTENFLLKVRFYNQQKKITQPRSEHLAENIREWLGPFLGSAGNDAGSVLSPQKIHDALYWFLDGHQIEQSVPEKIKLTNGNLRKISYSVTGEKTPDGLSKQIIRPVLEIIIQQIFGCFETPKIMGMPVLLKLLSPARRPLQITDDLKGFWQNTWPEICKEMKGRYPKHNWDYHSMDTSEKI
jgi:ATP-dependent helicase HrpB